MAQTYFAILTAIGEAKLANATALGTTLQLTKMAVGDGNGNTPIPSRTQTALVHENRRAPLNTLFVDPANASQIVAEQVIPEDIGGWWVRELGLYDAAGDLCAVANCPDTYKPVLASGSGRTQIIRMVLIVANTSAVELKIDPSVVLAPRGYVDQMVGGHIAAADPHPQYATNAALTAHNAAADPHPQYLTSAEGDAKVAAAVAALVASSPAALDTLAELASALGNDPNFATTITNALALKAPLASPALTGAPTTPTPPQFDSSSRLANMAAVQRALGNHSSVIGITGSIALTQVQLGSFVEVTGGSGVAITLCNVTGAGGGAFRFYNNTANSVTVSAAAGQNININRSNVSSFTLMPGEACDIVTDGVSWTVTGGIGSSSLASIGYQKLSSGLIIQWGQISTEASGSVAITYPLAFPNKVFSIIPGSNSGVGSNQIVSSYPPFPKTGFTAYSNNGAVQLSWLATGN